MLTSEEPLRRICLVLLMIGVAMGPFAAHAAMPVDLYGGYLALFPHLLSKGH